MFNYLAQTNKMGCHHDHLMIVCVQLMTRIYCLSSMHEFGELDGLAVFVVKLICFWIL